MRKIAATIAKGILNVLYWLFCAFERRGDRVLFLSRQSDEPSYDFLAIAEQFEKRGWSARMLVMRFSAARILPYALHTIKAVRELARCNVCVLDGYHPAVSLLNLKCEEVKNDKDEGEVVNKFCPLRPLVLQVWHAFGSFKKFGFQSIDTPEGRAESTARAMCMHRNYSWIVCTGERDRKVFAEAFSYPVDRVVALGLPRYDELLGLKRGFVLGTDGSEECSDKTLRVLFAPTFRKDRLSQNPFFELRRSWDDGHLDCVEMLWSFHPLEKGEGAPLPVCDGLNKADIVVTDYSSIVYEAYLLGKKVVFYIPDIEQYRSSPGLNVDPLVVAPGISFQDEDSLSSFLLALANNEVKYPHGELDAFVGDSFVSCEPHVAERIVEFSLGKLAVSESQIVVESMVGEGL